MTTEEAKMDPLAEPTNDPSSMNRDWLKPPFPKDADTNPSIALLLLPIVFAGMAWLFQYYLYSIHVVSDYLRHVLVPKVEAQVWPAPRSCPPNEDLAIPVSVLRQTP